MMKKGIWKEEAFRDQLSVERDFPETPIGFKFALCCGHRTGSNLLGEALYKSGCAGDPMEFFNQRFLEAFREQRGLLQIDYPDYIREMQRRRTSPNGVFGINVKFDQLRVCFANQWKLAIRIIKDNDYVLFLYRRDKVRQAVSAFIGQSKDTFNVPAGVSDEVVKDLVADVEFNPSRIALILHNQLKIEAQWRMFFENQQIQYEELAYEDFTANYEQTIDHILARCGVPVEDRVIPEQPMKKISNEKNEEFRERFLKFIAGEPGFENDLA